MYKTMVLWLGAAAAAVVTSAGLAFEVPQHEHTHEKEFSHPDLWWRSVFQPLHQLPGGVARDAMADLAALGIEPEQGYFDMRSGRWGTLIITRPMIPGPGIGNQLRWSDFDQPPPRDRTEIRQLAWHALAGFLAEHQAVLKLDAAQFGEPVVSMHDDRLIRIYLPRQYQGVPVRDSFASAAINSGNLVLMGQRNWGDIDLDVRPGIPATQAEQQLRGYLEDTLVVRFHAPPRLEIIPVSDQREETWVETPGSGLDYRLVWVISPILERDIGTWEALVDAHTGELLAFRDTNHYASRQVSGGVYPVSNDGQPPDGVEQPGWPMPFADLSAGGSTVYTTTGGNVPPSVGSAAMSTSLNGQYVRINDTCGAISESVGVGDSHLDLGHGPGTDCAVPPGGSAGNTHAARSGFYELNRIKEQARGYLPDNNWLQGVLQANMNINNNCNATFSPGTGQVNFYTSGGGCANTGEIAAVFDHEWGHGMDYNDGAPGVSIPGEGIADIYAINRLNDSCVGRGFRPGQNCDGFGDACLECTGVRESDWAKQASGQPHDVAWVSSSCPGPGSGSSGPCGRSTHCEGSIVAETAWDLVHRDFQGYEISSFNYDLHTALELGTRLAYYGSHTVVNWYQCVTDGTAGCNADGGYLNYLAANDDNGSLTDGTPHMTAIHAAFNRHGIACPTPAVQNSGCADGPQSAPQNLAGVAFDEGAALTWDPVAGADEYWIFRTEGVHGCDFGKTRVGITSATDFLEEGLRNEFDVYYSVLAVDAGGVCTSPMSECIAVTPEQGPSGVIQGIVTRAGNGAVIAGAEVSIEGDIMYTVLTDENGAYQRTVLEDIYTVHVSMPGHADAVVEGVVVDEGVVLTVDFALDSPIAAIAPAAMTLAAVEGHSNQTVLEIVNIGTLDLTWDIDRDDVQHVTGAARSHDPLLDEVLDIPDFIAVGSASPSPVMFNVPAGLTSRGQVIGFSFQGTVSGISGSSSWASDLCMIIESPDGATFSVGGYSASISGCNINQWDFNGGGSSNDGTYASVHDAVFDPAAEDEGDWTFTFVNGWASNNADNMSWSDVTVTLHKTSLPICLEPEPPAWLDVHTPSGTTAPDAVDEISIVADADSLTVGVYEAYLCVTTNDIEALLVPVPVELTVIEPPPGELGVDPMSLDFGEQPVGSETSGNFLVANLAMSGALDVEIDSIQITSGEEEFFVGGGDCTAGTALAGQQSCVVEIIFSPTAAGEFVGEVTVQAAGGESVTIALAGSAILPGELGLEPGVLDFGEVRNGQTHVLVITASNAQAQAGELTLIEISGSGDAEFTLGDGGNCVAAMQLQSDENCTIEVLFSPESDGDYTGQLSVSADNGVSLQVLEVLLTGSGITPPPGVFEDRFEVH